MKLLIAHFIALFAATQAFAAGPFTSLEPAELTEDELTTYNALMETIESEEVSLVRFDFAGLAPGDEAPLTLGEEEFVVYLIRQNVNIAGWMDYDFMLKIDDGAGGHEPGGDMILSARDNAISGGIRARDDAYNITPIGENVSVMALSVPSEPLSAPCEGYPDCEPDIPMTEWPEPVDMSGETGVIDVLVIYSQDFVDMVTEYWANGENGEDEWGRETVEEFSDQVYYGIGELNDELRRSWIDNVTVRNVTPIIGKDLNHPHLDFVLPKGLDYSCAGPGVCFNEFMANSPEVAALRFVYGADIVVAIGVDHGEWVPYGSNSRTYIDSPGAEPYRIGASASEAYITMNASVNSYFGSTSDSFSAGFSKLLGANDLGKPAIAPYGHSYTLLNPAEYSSGETLLYPISRYIGDWTAFATATTGDKLAATGPTVTSRNRDFRDLQIFSTPERDPDFVRNNLQLVEYGLSPGDPVGDAAVSDVARLIRERGPYVASFQPPRERFAPDPVAAIYLQGPDNNGTMQISWNEAVGAEYYEIWASDSFHEYSAQKIARVDTVRRFTSTLAPGDVRFFWVVSCSDIKRQCADIASSAQRRVEFNGPSGPPTAN